jgi:DNA helicase II / ATP-dependent DNA helicase PcrA
MPITQEQIQAAQNQQHIAAHDLTSQVRLIAGPGSGKSFAIQERVNWLLARNIRPDSVFVVSFTRASTLDLHTRIVEYCKNAEQISVSTLHSLALRALRSAGLLNYPAEPLVMSNWEQENILDNEFSRNSGYVAKTENGYSKRRCKDIRSDYEAFCGTGHWVPPNHIPPSTPISDEERRDYEQFHNPRTQIYSCVLPGEIIRQCVVKMEAGILNPVDLLRIQHLVVDEYQDLNPIDLEFVDKLIDNGVETFVAGDDDQSIYSFRFASPQGIQSFAQRFPEAGDHELTECFRCTSDILGTAQHVIEHFSEPDRIQKRLTSLYANSEPPVSGAVHRWRFNSFVREVRSIAASCSSLIDHGVSANKIMILISNKRSLLPAITRELDNVNVEYEAPKSDSFFETSPGRFALAILRIVCNLDDYIAHRLILGLRSGVGPATCNRIASSVITSNLNYRDIFYQPLPQGVFNGRELSALNHARNLCAEIADWSCEETLNEHINEISVIINRLFGEQSATEWQESVSFLPAEITLQELLNYFRARTDEQQVALLETVYERLEIPIPEEGLLPAKVRIMTMHGAKGLSAQVVFIPGLVEDMMPGRKRQPYPGLVLEAARMLYVSITRAQAACILSYSNSRVEYGNYAQQRPSRFNAYLDGVFTNRNNGITDVEADIISQSIDNL